MRKINKFLFLVFLAAAFFCAVGDAAAQSKKRKAKPAANKRAPVATVRAETRAVVVGIGSVEAKQEPSLILEPCAKETPEQIGELEGAADKTAQIKILLDRIGAANDWTRACAIYRLGEFRTDAREALPVVIKLLRDEEKSEIWTHVETALWKIPPEPSLPLAERVRLAESADVYLKIYGIFTLAYYRVPPASTESKKALSALIEAARDADTTAAWLAVMGIREFGFRGADTSAAIPVLSELLRSGKVNPIHPVRAIVPMNARAIAAAPLLFDVLYNPKKYARGGKDEDDTAARSYSLYITTAIALGRIGKPLLPLLEREIEKHPFAVLQVLSNMSDAGVLPILYRAMKNENAKARAKAIESLPSLTSIGALEALPHLLAAATRDADADVRKAAMSKIGWIAGHTKDKSVELRKMFKTQAVPALVKILTGKDEDVKCYAALTLGDFGADAEAAIPALARQAKKENGGYCARSALFDLGNAGKRFLTAEQIKDFEENKKWQEEYHKSSPGDYNKAKPIKPKASEKKSTAASGDGT